MTEGNRWRHGIASSRSQNERTPACVLAQLSIPISLCPSIDNWPTTSLILGIISSSSTNLRRETFGERDGCRALPPEIPRFRDSRSEHDQPGGPTGTYHLHQVVSWVCEHVCILIRQRVSNDDMFGLIMRFVYFCLYVTLIGWLFVFQSGFFAIRALLSPEGRPRAE